MRILLLAAVAGAVALPTAANAQYRGDYRDSVRYEQRQCQRDLRRAETRREYDWVLRHCRHRLQAERIEYRGGYGDRHYGGDYYRNDGRYWDGYRWRVR
jgi:hypothetical protein